MLQAPQVLTIIFHGLKQWRDRDNQVKMDCMGCATVWLTRRLGQGRRGSLREEEQLWVAQHFLQDTPQNKNQFPSRCAQKGPHLDFMNASLQELCRFVEAPQGKWCLHIFLPVNCLLGSVEGNAFIV